MLRATISHLTPHAEEKLAHYIRQCKDSFGTASPTTDANRITACLRDGHTDTLRHAYLSLDVSGPPTVRNLFALGVLSDAARYLDRCLLASSDPSRVSYRYTGNFQTWRELFTLNRREQFALMTDWLDPVEATMQRYCPNVFGRDGVPVPVERRGWSRMPSLARHSEGWRVELWECHEDDQDTWHGYATFKIVCDKATSIHLDRHGLDGILRFSQRYVDQAKVARHYPAKLLDGPFGADVQALDERTNLLYRAMVARGSDGKRLVRLEDARYITNMAWESSAFVTGRLTTWHNFVLQRDDSAAQFHTVQQIGRAMREILTELGQAPQIEALAEWQRLVAGRREPDGGA